MLILDAIFAILSLLSCFVISFHRGLQSTYLMHSQNQSIRSLSMLIHDHEMIHNNKHKPDKVIHYLKEKNLNDLLMRKTELPCRCGRPINSNNFLIKLHECLILSDS